jgi:hypothetical protein
MAGFPHFGHVSCLSRRAIKIQGTNQLKKMTQPPTAPSSPSKLENAIAPISPRGSQAIHHRKNNRRLRLTSIQNVLYTVLMA